MSRPLNLACSAALALASLGAHSVSQLDDCTPEWLPTFGGRPFGGNVYSLAVGDDGSGGQPELYAGGTFYTAGFGLGNCIAKWDGWSWSPVGTGMVQSGDKVEAIVVSDAIAGTPIVYAGGKFSLAGGLAASNIAQWDGSTWAPLGSGVSGVNAEVRALAIFDDGGGPALYAGGSFSTAGGVAAGRVAKWNGSSWSPVGTGISGGEVKALTVFDDGNGPALYAGGTFSMAGGLPANRVAKWNGSTWSALGSGLGGWVYALATFDDGSGPALYAAGTLPLSSSVARWNGTSWTAVGTGLGNIAMALTSYDDGSGAGPRLYAAGDLFLEGSLQHIARLDGSTWVSVAGGLDSFAYALTPYDDGSPQGPALLVGGIFDEAGDVSAHGLGRWDGDEWTGVGNGFNGTVSSSAIFDDGGTALFVGGSFQVEAGAFSGNIARWDGIELTTPGGGLGGPVNELTVFDDQLGSGPALYAGGSFTTAGGAPASRVAKWDGSSWSALGSGMNDEVRAWAVFDDGAGGGPALFAGGEFSTAGGAPANRIARWNGTGWSPLGSGLNGNVHSLAVYDDGGGAALYAGGAFTIAGEVPANRIAKWNGTAWSPLGTGVDDGPSAASVLALLVLDDGRGEEVLLAGGDFTAAGGAVANRLATWDGTSWSPFANGVNATVAALASLDGAVYAGGSFTIAGGVPAEHVAKWDGASWQALDAGVNGVVLRLEAFDDGSGGGTALFVGGQYTQAPDSGDSYLAKWGCPAAEPVWTDLGFGLAGVNGVPSLVGTGTLVAGSPGSLTLSSAKPSALTNLLVSFASIPTPFKGGTLVPVPSALTLALFTNGAGSIPLAWAAWPAGVPSGASLYFQYAIADPAASAGVALSNALHATTP